MRTLLALTLALAACGHSDRPGDTPAHDAPSASRSTDAFLLRVARSGGTARVVAYPATDSVVWSAPGAPGIAQVLGFDPDEGVIAFVDRSEVPGRIDLRLGDVSRAGSRYRIANARSADGSSVYGVAGGKAVRFTTTGRLELATGARVAAVFPQRDGSVIVVGRDTAGAATLYRVFPTSDEMRDSVQVEGLAAGPRIQAGDRLYLATDGGFAIVNTRDLSLDPPLALEGTPRDAAPTPSGDRLFVALEGDSSLVVWERFRNRVVRSGPLPGEPRALRMDPVGRFVLVRPATGDSAWVIAVGTSKLVGTVRSAWRTDLPFVAPDGAIATARGDDVVFVDGTTMRVTRRVEGGAADYWFPFQWSGFRPRAAALDEPVEFAVGTSDSAADSTLAAAAAASDSARRTGDSAASVSRTPAAPQWLVSFAALLVESSATGLAREIAVHGQQARVAMTMRDGVPVYRVVLGPFADREAAERVGRASGRPYWVYAAAAASRE